MGNLVMAIPFGLALPVMKNTPFGTEADILAVVQGFQNRTLPKESWTHEAHLVTALWYHVNHSPLEAVCYLRSGIIAYNVSVGGKNTPQDGYHETMTLFWCRTIHQFVQANPRLPVIKLVDKFLKSEMASKEYPLKFYSRERLFSLEARALWVEPDNRIAG